MKLNFVDFHRNLTDFRNTVIKNDERNFQKHEFETELEILSHDDVFYLVLNI